MWASLVALLAAGLIGCSPEIHWRGYMLEPVYKDSRRDNKLTLVYMRNWYMPECTDFEDGALRDPQVLAAAEDMYAVQLEYDWSPAQAREWNISRPPAVVILHPDGRVLARIVGIVDAPALLNAIERARAVLNEGQPVAATP